MKKLSCLILISLAAVISANAQTIYTARSVYNTAHPGNFVIDFNSLTSTDGTFYPSGFSVATPVGAVGFQGLPVTATSTELLRATHFGFSSPANDGNYVLYGNAGQFNTDSMSITLPANSFTFGLDIVSPSATVAEPYTFTIMSGANVLGTVTPIASVSGQYNFFGFDSLSTPITSVRVQITNAIGNPEPVLDNFTVAVPEPSTYVLLGFGSLLAAAANLRTSRRAPILTAK